MYRITIFSDTRDHASSSINLAIPPPHVHTSPTTAPRVSLSRSLAHPVHTKQHASDQGGRVWNQWKPFLLRLVSSPLPCSSHSLALSSLVLLVISLLMFYPLSCFLYWCTYRHSSTLMIKLEAIIDSISCCRVWQWEAWGREQGGEGEGEGERERERETGMNEDWEARVIHQ